MLEQRRNPGIYGPYGPVPPRHPRKRASQFVWPRDKPHSSIFGRMKDVLQGKGPDVWVTRRGSDGPHRPVWSGWRTLGPHVPGAIHWDNLGYKYVDRPNGPDLPLAPSRAADKKFDFRTRRFARPKFNTWSDIKYDHQDRTPIYHRNRDGDWWWNEEFEHFLDENPFEYDHWDNFWSWDELRNA